jgi:hypothetical protein
MVMTIDMEIGSVVVSQACQQIGLVLIDQGLDDGCKVSGHDFRQIVQGQFDAMICDSTLG